MYTEGFRKETIISGTLSVKCYSKYVYQQVPTVEAGREAGNVWKFLPNRSLHIVNDFRFRNNKKSNTRVSRRVKAPTPRQLLIAAAATCICILVRYKP